MTLDDKEIRIDDIEVTAFYNESTKHEVIQIGWWGNIGYGDYTMYRNHGKWKAKSECMDDNEHKDFIRLLLDKFIEDLEVTG